MTLHLTPIGHVAGGGSRLLVAEPFRPCLDGLDGFSHLLVLWWFDRCDAPADRALREEHRPYAGGPDRLGTFATRSPRRPNPLGVDVVAVRRIDVASGVVEIGFIDAADDSPILDVKPYTPASDRVARPRVPSWCAQWPRSVEDSARFDWGAVLGDARR